MTTKQDLKTRIKGAIEACAGGDFGEQARNLLATLGYQGPRLSYFTQKNFAEFDALFVQGNERFNPKKAQAAQWASVDVLLQLTAAQLKQQDSLFTQNKVDPTAYESYLFFAIELKPKGKGQAWTRTDLSQITREVNKLFLMPAMILFKHGDALSFSVIDRRLHKRESSKDVLEKVTLIKDIRTSATNRAHIEILFDLSVDELRRVHKFTTFPGLHEAWRKTLDTKELNRKFFRELSNWYFHAVATTEWPDDAEKDKDKRNATNTIRLITRLMFVWFLREKELVPDELFDRVALGLGGEGGPSAPLRANKQAPILKPDAKEPSLYYKAVLQNLFFATLNTEMGKRRFLAKPDKSRSPHHFIHNVFRYEHCFADPQRALKELFDPIPFLNGGLFECLDKETETKAGLQRIRIDGFSNNPKNPLHLPDSLFFNPEGEEHDFSEVYGTARARKEKVRGLIDILSSYKFTITENTPIEEEVALDPELLGKVFENLLANYNPETKTTARKQTGSFYTPREIVNYMVDESLIAYLKGALTPALSEGEGAMPLTPALSKGEGEMPADDAPAWAEKPGYMTGDPATAAKLMAHANSMRKNPTKAEDKLWQVIRGHATGGRVRRQHIIGNFIVDFVSLPKRLVIEIDGDIHDLQKEQDEARTTLLNEYGFKVIRFRNEEVLADVFAVKRAVVAELDARPDVTEAHSPPSPPERGPGGEGALNERALTSTLSEGEGERRLRHLLSYTEEPHPFSKAETEKLIAAIDHCKILDPACGSGAFPMGVLHKLVHVLHKLDPNNKKWKERQIEKAEAIEERTSREAAIARLERAFEKNELDYSRKLYLIEYCIHGVDIQAIAMQIAKLRFFISLIVDQRALPYDPVTSPDDNRGVEPLPNLETKFVAANTLMKLEQENANLFTDPAIDKKKEALRTARHKYFRARSTDAKAKQREADKRLRTELAELLVQNHDFQSATAKMLAAWDPYDQNASAPFFDPEWMFGLNGGFDVVIGNPPYVRQESFKHLKPDLQTRYPETFTSTADLFTYFMQAGHELLAPGGVFCYIVSNKWMRAGYGAKLRAYLGRQKLLQLLDFGEQPVFEATAYTCVLLSQKATPPKDHAVRTWSFTDLPLHDLPAYVHSHAHAQLQSAFVQADYRIGDAAAERLMAKLKATGQPLGEYLKGGIYYGIKTGYNKAFVIDKATRDALIKADKRSKEVIKPFLGGRDIERYKQPNANRWLICIPFGYTKALLGKNVKDEAAALRGMKKEVPAIMTHLLAHEAACISRDDQGQFWWELRSCDYYPEFEKDKIIYSEIAFRGDFLLDTGKNYVDTTIYIMSNAEPAMLGYLNSSLCTFVFAGLSSSIQGGYFRWKRQYIEMMPYLAPPPKVKSQLENLVEQRMALPPGAAAEAIEKQIDQVVYGLYGLTAAEVALVEAGVGASRGKGGGKKKGADGGED